MGVFSTRVDLFGKTFNRLTVIGFSHTHHKQAYWKCLCECGNVHIARGRHLTSNKIKSCGCYRSEKIREIKTIPHKNIDGTECKRCYCCDSYLPLVEFHKCKPNTDGLEKKCKKCCSRLAIVNALKYRLTKNKWAKNKYKNDINYKIKNCISARIRLAIKNNYKAMKTIEFLGISIDEFKLYLQERFTPEMNWENYGKVWHIDHIRPCVAFDLSKSEQQKKCFHYTNLQPLSVYDNLKKMIY